MDGPNIVFLQSRKQRYHPLVDAVQVTVHRGEHLPEGIDYLHAFFVDVRPVLRIGGTPQAEHHLDEFFLAASRLGLGRDEGLEDEVARRGAAGVEHRVLQQHHAGRVAVAVGEKLEVAVAPHFASPEEHAAVVGREDSLLAKLLHLNVGEQVFLTGVDIPLADAANGMGYQLDVVGMWRMYGPQVEHRACAVAVLHLGKGHRPPLPLALLTRRCHMPVVAVLRDVLLAQREELVGVHADASLRHLLEQFVANLLRLALHARPVVHQFLQYAVVGI